MKLRWVICLAMVGMGAAHAVRAEGFVCEAPSFALRSLPRQVGVNQEMRPLVTETEAREEDAGKRLALRPGPYGHSELGFRYLARLFGYPGDFKGGKAAVEAWLAEEEFRNPLNEGLHQRWDHWVVNAPRRLSVPLGPVSRVPRDAGPEIFFKDVYEQKEFNRCVGMDIAVLRCENSSGEQLRSGHVVYFSAGAPSAGRSFCKTYWRGAVTERAPDSETATEERTITQRNELGSTTTTVKKSWERKKEGAAGNAPGGANPLGGPAGGVPAR